MYFWIPLHISFVTVENISNLNLSQNQNRCTNGQWMSKGRGVNNAENRYALGRLMIITYGCIKYQNAIIISLCYFHDAVPTTITIIIIITQTNDPHGGKMILK